jgi:RNA polymerase sigma-70 factor (ECF subfamily)
VWIATEAIDEAMTRAYQRWDRVSEYENPEGWVYRVAVNWSRSALRKRRNEVLREDLPERGTVDDSSDFDLRAAMERLPVKYRTVVVARYLLDWSTQETAAALRIPEGTVKSRLTRALDRLAIDLEGGEL